MNLKFNILARSWEYNTEYDKIENIRVRTKYKEVVK